MRKFIYCNSKDEIYIFRLFGYILLGNKMDIREIVIEIILRTANSIFQKVIVC